MWCGGTVWKPRGRRHQPHGNSPCTHLHAPCHPVLSESSCVSPPESSCICALSPHTSPWLGRHKPSTDSPRMPRLINTYLFSQPCKSHRSPIAVLPRRCTSSSCSKSWPQGAGASPVSHGYNESWGIPKAHMGTAQGWMPPRLAVIRHPATTACSQLPQLPPLAPHMLCTVFVCGSFWYLVGNALVRLLALG